MVIEINDKEGNFICAFRIGRKNTKGEGYRYQVVDTKNCKHSKVQTNDYVFHTDEDMICILTK